MNRDRISKNEEGTEEIKKQLAEATASGDMDKVIELAEKAKIMKGEKEEFIDKDEEEAYAENAEMVAMEEVKKRTAELAAKELEEAKLKDERESAAKAQEILKKINGEPAEQKQNETEKGGEIDAVALNNKMVGLKEKAYGERISLEGPEAGKAYREALENMSQQEISAVAKNIATEKPENMLSFLENFNNKAEIIAQPEIMEAFKNELSKGNVHLYDIDRIIYLPNTKELFDDPEVQKGVQDSIRRFVAYQNYAEWPHVADAVERVVAGANIDSRGLRNIAESLKGNTDVFHLFVKQFGHKRIYPEG